MESYYFGREPVWLLPTTVALGLSLMLHPPLFVGEIGRRTRYWPRLRWLPKLAMVTKIALLIGFALVWLTAGVGLVLDWFAWSPFANEDVYVNGRYTPPTMKPLAIVMGWTRIAGSVVYGLSLLPFAAVVVVALIGSRRAKRDEAALQSAA